MLIFLILLLVMFGGLIMYLRCQDGRLAEIGRLMFLCGLFLLLYALLTGHTMTLPRLIH